MDKAIEVFKSLEPEVWSLSPSDPDAARKLDYIARLLDRDLSYLAQVRTVLAKFVAARQKGLRLAEVDGAHVDMAAGIIQLHEHHYEKAICHFRFAREVADRIKDLELRAMSSYYLARSHYKKGDHAVALSLAQKAEQLTSGHVRVVALVRMVKGWILFLQGEQDKAEATLLQARQVLWRKGDHVEDCNILSFEGRILRQKGKFAEAAAKFRDAIKVYSAHHDETHHGLARCLVHLAFTLILEWRQLRAPAQRQSEYLAEALERLEKAGRICEGRPYKRVLDRVYYYRAVLYCEQVGRPGVRERQEAENAYKTAQAAEDRVIMCHARILQSMIEQEDYHPDEADKFAEAALKIANETDSRRALARARINRAMCFLRGPIPNIEDAQKCLDEAKKSLRDGDQDYLRVELEEAERELKGARLPERADVPLTWFTGPTGSLKLGLKRVEHGVVLAVLKKTRRNRVQAAQILGTATKRILAHTKHNDEPPLFVSRPPA